MHLLLLLLTYLGWKKYVSSLNLSGVIGYNPTSLSHVSWFQALFFVAISHSLLALFARQDSRKALPTFLKFVVGCLHNLKFCCQYQCFCFLTEIQHPSMLCLRMPSPFQGTYGTSVYLSSSLCLQIAFNCCHHVWCTMWIGFNAKRLQAFQHLCTCLHWRCNCGLAF